MPIQVVCTIRPFALRVWVPRDRLGPQCHGHACDASRPGIGTVRATRHAVIERPYGSTVIHHFPIAAGLDGLALRER